jgi:hypothetical protein
MEKESENANIPFVSLVEIIHPEPVYLCELPALGGWNQRPTPCGIGPRGSPNGEMR